MNLTLKWLCHISERLQQRTQVALIITPASDRTGVERLAHLPAARRCDDPLRAMEIHAGRLPIQAEKGYQLAAFGLEICDQCFVLDVEHPKRQCPTPMRSQTFRLEISPTAIGQIV